jgi:hypothetical protein
MNAQIRQLQRLLDATPDAKGRARIEKMIAKATRDAQRANKAARKMAREADKIAQRNRSLDTQRKIVAGAICLSAMTRDEQFHEQVKELLRKHTEKRYWFHFPEAFTDEEIEQATAEVEAERKQAAAEARARKEEHDLDGANDNVPDDMGAALKLIREG